MSLLPKARAIYFFEIIPEANALGTLTLLLIAFGIIAVAFNSVSYTAIAEEKGNCDGVRERGRQCLNSGEFLNPSAFLEDTWEEACLDWDHGTCTAAKKPLRSCLGDMFKARLGQNEKLAFIKSGGANDTRRKKKCFNYDEAGSFMAERREPGKAAPVPAPLITNAHPRSEVRAASPEYVQMPDGTIRQLGPVIEELPGAEASPAQLYQQRDVRSEVGQ